MKTKRLLSLFLVLTLWLTLTGCGNDTAPTDTAIATIQSTVTTTVGGGTTTTAVTDAPSSTTLVVSTMGDVTASPTTTTTTAATSTATAKPTTTATAAPSAEQMLVDEAFRLAEGESLPDTVTLTGVVTNVKEISESYGNATFDLSVEGTDGAKTIYCYRTKPADGTALSVTVGDVLTLTGTVQNYKGTVEFYPATFAKRGTGAVTAATTRPTGSAAIDEDGIYDSKEDVALYLHTYGKLPKNFVTKSEYNRLGEPADKCCGGDRFMNREGLLPNKSGRLYYECDIDTYGTKIRGSKRIVYSNDGLIYYTGDHYSSFTLLYGEP